MAITRSNASRFYDLGSRLAFEGTTEDTVAAPSLAYNEMATKWDLLHDLLGGTIAMQAADQKWLPKEDGETTRQYQARLLRSVLYSGYADAVEKLANRPFSKPVTVEGQDLPEGLGDIVFDVDRAGTDLTQFTRDVFLSLIIYGMTHILVDFPRITPGSSLADERATGARPIFVHVPPPRLFAWYAEGGNTGPPLLRQVRIKETEVERKGSYIEEAVDVIRVINDSSWEIWRKRDRDKAYIKEEEGLHTFDGVPLVTAYINRTGFMTAAPPLEDLAWINLAHWQSASDQRNILRFSRFGILYAAGLSEEEKRQTASIGPAKFFRFDDPQAKVAYAEHSGRAIEAGERDLKELRDQMEILGEAPLISAPGNVTATERAIGENRSQSALQSWVRNTENAINQAFEVAAQWTGKELPDDFTANIFDDFGLSSRRVEDIKALLDARKIKEISRETFLREYKRRGLLPDSLDVEEEIERLEEEGPSLETAFAFGDEGQEEDEDAGT